MTPELTTGWLSPTGEFFETELYGHIDKAREIARRIFPDFADKPRSYSYDSALQAAGWVGIYLSSFFCREWLFGFEGHLTPEQIRFLEPYTRDYIPLNSYSLHRFQGEVEL